MLKALASGLLISSILLSVYASDNEFPRCNCEDDGFWSVENILEVQRVSDFLIAVAYFSIPLELIYFLSCSNIPFKWVLVQFIAFIVLCAITHLLNALTYGPHPFQLMLFLTIFKFLTALVSCATAITLITLIPLLLKVKVREFMLRKKTWDLGREVVIIKNKKDAGWHVRMLTQEIRKSLDKHTILYTTLVELSKTLELKNCAVWMPNEYQTEMNLTHELNGRNFCNRSIPTSDEDVIRIKQNHGVNILSSDSALGVASSGESGEFGPVAAIRMPMLRVSNFKGGTPELLPASYAILVLVLPNGHSRDWTNQELEIVQVVADQVAVALSHAAVLEESQLMRDKLVEQNRALQQAKSDAMMASQARSSFHKVMSNGMRRPMHSISGLLSIIQDHDLTSEQQAIVDPMVKSSSVLSALMNDVMEISLKDNGRFLLEMNSFKLHSMIKEAASLAKCLCVYKGFEFSMDVEKSLPDQVLGDERRIFQVILHMFGNLLNRCHGGGRVTFRVGLERGSEGGGGSDKKWSSWKSNLSNGFVLIRFEIGVNDYGAVIGSSSSTLHGGKTYTSDEEGLSFSMCRRLVQLMQGNIWVGPNPHDSSRTMTLVLRLKLQPPISPNFPEPSEKTSDHPNSNTTLFRGLQVLLAADDDVNRAVTRKMLEKLGCSVSSVSSGSECLTAIRASSSPFRIAILDLQLPEFDGFEVAMRIRKFRSRNWPLIIALTANADDDLFEQCLQVGINGVIRKPVLLRGIADELRRVLQQSTGKQSLVNPQ